MQKLTLASAALAASNMAFAASMTCSVGGGINNGLVYTTTATSNGISVTASSPVNVYYVDNALSASSSLTNPAPPPPNPYTLIVNGDWCIDTTSGAFTGNIAYGNYKTQTNVGGTFAVDGRQTFVGVNQAFNGTGTWGGTLTNPTLSFSFFNSTISGGGASTHTGTSSSCLNGRTTIPYKVCNSFALVSPDWEGLAFTFTFDPARYLFTGALIGTDTSGTGIYRNTVTINWNIAGVDPPAEVPLPASTWLFGSALLGLAATGKRRRAAKRC